MKRTIVVLSFVMSLGMACSSGPEKNQESQSDAVVEDSVSEQGVMKACRQAATEATSLVHALENAPTSDLSFADYRKMASAHAAWSAENHPCTAEGPEVTERARTAGETRAMLERAEQSYVISKLDSLVAQGKLEAARELMVLRFAQGRAVESELQAASYSLSKSYAKMLNEAFEASGKSAQFEDDLKTTCIFSRTEFDPQNTPVEDHHASVFGGKGTVYALCRLPLPASKYGGDPNGMVKLVIDTDENDANGVLAETNLGAISKYKESQYFRGRFPIPQGIGTDELSAYYHVRVKLERPEMGDESPVGNGFWWFADE